MRKDVVDAAGVEVEALAEVMRAHRGTLDVPAGEPWPPWRVPDQRPIRFGALPEREVRGVTLARIELGADPLPKCLADVPGKPSVAGEALDGEVHRPLDLVREPTRNEPLDERDHLGHVIGCAREVGGRNDAEAPLVRME